MNLRPYQNEALKIILSNYSLGKKSIIIDLPIGSGKSILAIYTIKNLITNFKIKSIAYVVGNKSIESAFISLSEELLTNYINIFKVYTYSELLNSIDKKQIENNRFEILIFDDFGLISKKKYNIIYNYFHCFKIIFSNNNFNNINEKLNITNSEIVYKYSLEDAINDGYIITSQKTQNDTLFENISNQINEIEIDENGTNQIREQLNLKLEFLKNENIEYSEALNLIQNGKIELAEIHELSHKKEQLCKFEKLLKDEDYFKEEQNKCNGPESVWQSFFEDNPWIFGFGLNYIFNTPLEGKKLEQVIEGYSIVGNGKRTDALLKTTGLIQTLCFGEIKTHKKNILKNTSNAYRPESWAISDEFAGGISQIHKTIQKSLRNINNSLSIYDEEGYKLQHPIYLYKPKSFLIIGSLQEFKNKNGDIHEDKFSSFELFRRSISDIEVITFDEIFERANAIVRKKWKK